MAKIQIKSEKITPFGGIFHVRELFSRFVAPIIDKVLGIRCTSFGYQYSEIVGSLASVYFCGGDCVEDVTGVGAHNDKMGENKYFYYRLTRRWLRRKMKIPHLQPLNSRENLELCYRQSQRLLPINLRILSRIQASPSSRPSAER